MDLHTRDENTTYTLDELEELAEMISDRDDFPDAFADENGVFYWNANGKHYLPISMAEALALAV